MTCMYGYILIVGLVLHQGPEPLTPRPIVIPGRYKTLIECELAVPNGELGHVLFGCICAPEK